MTERGRFQRGIDTIVEGTRNHAEISVSGGALGTATAIETSPIPTPVKEMLAIPPFLVGVIIGIYAMANEYYKRNIDPYIGKGKSQHHQIPLTPGVELVLTGGTEESPPTS